PVYEPRAALLLAETRQDLHLLQIRVPLPWLFDTPKGSDRWVDGCPGSSGPRLRSVSPVPVHPPKPPVLALSLRKVLPPGLRGSVHHDSKSAFSSAGDCSVPPRVERSDVLNSILNFWMVWQAREKTDPALSTVDGHLCPEAWWIGIWSAEIGDALLDQTGCPVQTAQ